MTVVPCASRHWSLFAPMALFMGASLLRKERFDFIQVQEPYLTGIIGATLSLFFNVPLIAGLYADEIDNPVWLKERFLNRIANMAGKIVLRRSRAARADSKAVADRIQKSGYCPVTFIPFFITHAEKLMASNPDAAGIRERLLERRKGPLLLAVNRLEPEKNVALMLRAFARFCEKNDGAILAVAGTGRLEKELKELADKIAPERVRWLGWVSEPQMAAYYQAADMMVISSSRESSARVLSESLLASTAVLSTDTAGAREVVEDGLSGRIVPVGDEAAFAEALREMAEDVQKLKDMGAYGRKRTESRMTGAAVAAAMRDFYQKALMR
jgi:glycosyltransferase involved in cell wall biosynthesis